MIWLKFSKEIKIIYKPLFLSDFSVVQPFMHVLVRNIVMFATGAKLAQSFMSLVAHAVGFSLWFCVVLSRRKSLTSPGRDINPLQVSSQQMLVLIYIPRKDGKLS